MGDSNTKKINHVIREQNFEPVQSPRKGGRLNIKFLPIANDLTNYACVMKR